ncbi:hypothetical protein, partial [Salmonella sp. s54836]|uniref:hypothetical protein n=1 Tax=Salmonella sp. s54836 TaxID=3159673 RepID=UPI00397F4C69
MVRQLQDNINKLELDTLDIPTVDIKWDTDSYSSVVNNVCSVVISKLDYVNRTRPIWSTVSKGEGQNQLSYSLGLAVDQVSGDIYVADCVASRIQIYNSIGEYSRTIKTTISTVDYRPAR